MGASCEKAMSIKILGPCAQFDHNFVATVNGAFGTTWDGKITGAWGSAGGMTFDCPQFNITGGVNNTNNLTMLSKIDPPSPCNPVTTVNTSTTPFTVWQWGNRTPGCPMFDRSVLEWTLGMDCSITDTCGANTSILHCPEANAFYTAWTGLSVSADLIRLDVGGTIYWWSGDAPPPALTNGIIILKSPGPQMFILNGDGIHTVQYSADLAIGCPIGNFRFTTVTFGPPPPPPALPDVLFVTP